MAETTVTEPETSRPIPKWRRHVLGGIMSVLVVSTGVGGVVGFLRGGADERHNNRANLETAAQDKKCLTLVQKNLQPGSNTAIIHLASLSPQQIIDCQIESPADTVNSYVSDANESYSSPLGAKISKPSLDAIVQLPSVDRLNSDITHQVSEAADFNHAVELEEMAVGMFFGLVGGVVIDAGLIIGPVNAADKRFGINQ